MAENNVQAMILLVSSFFFYHLDYVLSADIPLFCAVPLPTLVCVRAVISFGKVDLLIYSAFQHL